MSDTLRTDDAEKEFATKWAVKGAVSSSFARELERELLSCSDDCAFMDRARERIAALEAALNKCFLAAGYDAHGDHAEANALYAEAKAALAGEEKP
jgi:hypothetical protein